MPALGNPLTQQGLLNRVLTNVVFASFPQLNVSAPFMSKSLAQVTFDESAVDQIGTATGIVNSPKPYVMGQLVINVLRSQPVAALYVTQWESQAVVGSVTAYPDSNTFPPIIFANASILDIDPGAYDGQDPTTKVTIKGVFYTNAALWLGE